MTSLCTAVIATQVSLENFRLYVLSLFEFQDQDGKQPAPSDNVKKDKIERADSIHRVFEVLTTDCCSFLNIDIYKSIMKKYDIKAETEDLRYPNHLIDYIHKHKISEFLSINPRLKTIPDSLKKLTLKFDVKDTSKIAKVCNLKRCIAGILNLPPSALQLVDIEKGCVVVTFLIPTEVADYIISTLKDQQIADIQELSVKWLKCGDNILFGLEGIYLYHLNKNFNFPFYNQYIEGEPAITPEHIANAEEDFFAFLSKQPNSKHLTPQQHEIIY